MTSQTNILNDLIQAAYKGTVFGPHESFAQNTVSRIDSIQEQIKEIGVIFTAKLYACIEEAMPELSNKEILRIMKEIGPKAISFCPALTAGELTGEDNVNRLAAAASAIGMMYFADQSMDRGDEMMVGAIEKLNNNLLDDVSDSDAKQIATRASALRHIKSNIDHLALPEDAPIVLDCFTQQVLHNEVLLHKLSLEYLKIEEQNKYAFLATHAKQLADLMVIDAGFPSVTASLYAIYRHNDRELLPLSDVHSDETITGLLQICNTVVRIADETGDWEIDAGHHPDWGTFAINPFNQYHPDIIARLCELAHINDGNLELSLQQAFRDFHANTASTERYSVYVTDVLFDHVRDYINALPLDLQKTHSRYILLCKRVLEIGRVNMMGDKALADTDS